jgi:hypothetical protein
MADTIRAIVLSFRSRGGIGKKLAVTDSSGASAVDVPGNTTDPTICITNYGSYPAFVRWGKAPLATATTDCQCVLPGTQVTFDISELNQATLYVAAVCESGESTKIQVTRGDGN